MSSYEDQLMATGEREQILKYLRGVLAHHEHLWTGSLMHRDTVLSAAYHATGQTLRNTIKAIEQGKHLERT